MNTDPSKKFALPKPKIKYFAHDDDPNDLLRLEREITAEIKQGIRDGRLLVCIGNREYFNLK